MAATLVDMEEGMDLVMVLAMEDTHGVDMADIMAIMEEDMVGTHGVVIVEFMEQ